MVRKFSVSNVPEGEKRKKNILFFLFIFVKIHNKKSIFLFTSGVFVVFFLFLSLISNKINCCLREPESAFKNDEI